MNVWVSSKIRVPIVHRAVTDWIEGLMHQNQKGSTVGATVEATSINDRTNVWHAIEEPVGEFSSQ